MYDMLAWLEGSMLGNLGVLALDRGDLAGARQHLEQAAARARETSHRARELEWTVNLAVVTHQAGDVEEALGVMERAIDIARRTRRRVYEGVALGMHAVASTGLPFVIARKGTKAYSTAKLVEGEIYPGDRVVVVEDVISTGAQGIRAADRLVEVGAQVLGVLAVIDREQGGPEAISAAGYTLTTLFRRSQLGL